MKILVAMLAMKLPQLLNQIISKLVMRRLVLDLAVYLKKSPNSVLIIPSWLHPFSHALIGI